MTTTKKSLTAKAIRRHKGGRAEPLFRKGDRVTVTGACVIPEFVGVTATVVRVAWEPDRGDGNPFGWVCYTDLPFTAEAGRGFWESLLKKAD
jgi:hypothetical protein